MHSLRSGLATLLQLELDLLSVIERETFTMKRLTADQVKLGFIGLGNMGSRIAKRLIDHGYQLSAYDRNVAKAQAIAAQGGTVTKSILELAHNANVIISCLTNDEAVQSVYTGREGVLPRRVREPSCSR